MRYDSSNFEEMSTVPFLFFVFLFFFVLAENRASANLTARLVVKKESASLNTTVSASGAIAQVVT